MISEPIPFVKDKYPLQQARVYSKAPIDFVGEQLVEHGQCFGLRFANRNLVIVNNPDYVQQAFQSNHRNYIKATSYRKLKLMLGNGLFTSEGDFWLQQRRLIQPSFHKHELSHFIDIMVKESAQLVYRWEYFYKGGRSFSLLEELSELTLGIVCESLLGQRLESGAKIVNEELPTALSFMIRRVLFPINAPMWMPLPSHLKFKRSIGRIGKLISKLINEKKREGSEYPDLLWMLLQVKDEETGEGMSEQQLVDEMMTFFLAGHETTAVALSWALFLLHQNEEACYKARTEGTRLLSEGVTLESLGQATYLKQVAQEALRLYPPAWTLAREALEADQLGPYSISKGDTVVVNSYWLHRNLHHWKSPLEFKPERFEADAVKSRHKFAYIPFGGGPRLCIGHHFALFEMQIALATILSNFQVEILSPYQPFDCSLTLRPVTGMPTMAHRL